MAALAAIPTAGLLHALEQPPTLDDSSRAWVQSVITTWTTVSREHLRMAPAPLPWVVFYDEARAWHLNADAALLPPTHTASMSVPDESGQQHSLHAVLHDNGLLWLPDTSPLRLDARQPRMFTMPYAGGARALSVVPLPSWLRRAVGAEATTDPEILISGVAVHEMTHTRHLPDLIRRIGRLRERHPIPAGITENLVEQTYADDAGYTALYRQERDMLIQAAGDLDAQPAASLHLISRALALADERRGTYFRGDRTVFADLEDMFLVLEGVAVWAQFQAGRTHAPAGETWQTTAMNLLHLNTDWIQEEGFVLFVLIDRLVPGWQARFFEPQFPSPFVVLREAVEQRRASPAP